MVRFKNRYIVLEVLKGKNLKSAFVPVGELYKEFLKKIKQCHGDFGLASIQSGIIAKYHNPTTSIMFVRVRHSIHRLLTSVLPLINEVNHQPVVVRSLYLGATLKHCFIFTMKYQKSTLEKLWSQAKADDKRILDQGIKNVYKINSDTKLIKNGLE